MSTEVFIDLHSRHQYEVLWARRSAVAVAISLAAGMIATAIVIRRNSN